MDTNALFNQAQRLSALASDLDNRLNTLKQHAKDQQTSETINRLIKELGDVTKYLGIDLNILGVYKKANMEAKNYSLSYSSVELEKLQLNVEHLEQKLNTNAEPEE